MLPLNLSIGKRAREIHSLQNRLNSLFILANNEMDDGTVGVKVTRNTMEFKEGYIFSITFSGINVKGNIPEIELGSQATYYLGGSSNTDDIKKLNCYT